MLYNCNSLSKYLHDPNLIRSVMRQWIEMSFHILALTGTRINNNNSVMYDRAKSTYNALFQNGDLLLANTSGFSSKARSQPEGVGIWIHWSNTTTICYVRI